MNGFILAGALTFGQPIQQVIPSRDAPRYIAKALYRQLNLCKTVSNWERKYFNVDEHKELQYIGFIARAGIEKRVTIEWRF